MKILITGANGFVGNTVWRRFEGQPGISAVGSVRTLEVSRKNEKWISVGDLADSADWSILLAGVDVVVHTAARVHVLNEVTSDPLAEFRRVNVDGTMRLARQAAAFGVKRFIFVSSIKVHGESTVEGRPFHSDDVPSPSDPYGVSKLEAENALRELALSSGMELVIVRPPLVYGPGVKANFAAMMRWLSRGVPLPLGAIKNRRSLVALDNLVDLLVVCVQHPAASGQIFLVSDGEDVSTTQLLRYMGVALGCKTRLIPLPAALLEWGAALVGKREVARRLCGSLQVDIEKTCTTLQWRPPISLAVGLKKAARDFS
ncbi:SDR family oxidoreductase [Variovorax sp. UMC13]|uniref:UDP-glucose 4-epimerase family protein n=1 Tax=Variovorax sp. UMC13 TaxID=1862326 RepID=UPI0016019F12|nr:SDR family oxidoreductase [Variovorax sp. UMC13]MBB1603851.1 NAD-dependent dehydratase [Variovorax sp. UMC13]